jgi:hypothetical protein
VAEGARLLSGAGSAFFIFSAMVESFVLQEFWLILKVVVWCLIGLVVLVMGLVMFL